MGRVLLQTRRLTLRPVTFDDVPRLVELDSDPAVMRYVSGGTATSADTVADWVIPRMQAQQRDHGTGMWLIWDRTGGDDVDARTPDRFHGWAQLRTPRHSRRAELELSYRLRRDSWGHGYAAEASATLITMMFVETDTTRIFAGTHVANKASQRVMQRLGMRLAADSDAVELSSPDALVEYELLRETWYAGRGRAFSRASAAGAARVG